MNNKRGNQGKRGISAHDQFFAFVEKTDTCWLWVGAKSKAGYGKIARTENGKRKHYPAHKFAYLLLKGPISDGLFVCHNCPGRDNPACVNPEHLWLGTHSDNIKDAYKKGTAKSNLKPRLGSQNNAAKLTEEKVIHIRNLYSSGKYSQYNLADIFGVTQTTICAIVKGKIWPTVTNPYSLPTLHQARHVRLSVAHSGENSGAAKLTRAEVLEILDKYKNGISIKNITKDYPSVTRSAISTIIHGRAWKSVTAVT